MKPQPVRYPLALPSQHPVDLPYLGHVLRQGWAVLHQQAELLDLRQGAPVEVGAADVEVAAVGDPELGVLRGKKGTK